MDGRSLVGVTGNRYIMLLLIILLLTFAGMFVETTVVALLMTPILLPVVQSVGVEPVHFGVLMMTVVTGGIMTPPVGIALYTTSEIMGCKPQETAREAVPFYIAMLTVILIIAFIPIPLTTWNNNRFKGGERFSDLSPLCLHFSIIIVIIGKSKEVS